MDASRDKDLSVIKDRLIKKVEKYLINKQPVPEGLRTRLARIEAKMLDEKKKNEGKPKPLDWKPKANTVGPGGPANINPDNSKTTGFWTDWSQLVDKGMNYYTILAANAASQTPGSEAGASSTNLPLAANYGFDNFQVTILLLGVGLALYLNCRA